MSTLFPNGSAFMDWFARNCERCKRDGACYLKTDCPEFEAKPSISPITGFQSDHTTEPTTTP